MDFFHILSVHTSCTSISPHILYLADDQVNTFIRGRPVENSLDLPFEEHRELLRMAQTNDGLQCGVLDLPAVISGGRFRLHLAVSDLSPGKLQAYVGQPRGIYAVASRAL